MKSLKIKLKPVLKMKIHLCVSYRTDWFQTFFKCASCSKVYSHSAHSWRMSCVALVSAKGKPRLKLHCCCIISFCWSILLTFLAIVLIDGHSQWITEAHGSAQIFGFWLFGLFLLLSQSSKVIQLGVDTRRIEVVWLRHGIFCQSVLCWMVPME